MAPKAAPKSDEKTEKRTALRKPAVRRKAAPKTAATHEAIATRAYYIHLEGGEDPHENWLRAERELVGS